MIIVLFVGIRLLLNVFMLIFGFIFFFVLLILNYSNNLIINLNVGNIILL